MSQGIEFVSPAGQPPAQMITVAYGKINLAKASGSLACFKVTAPWGRASACDSGRRVSGFQKQWHPATTRPQIGGGFTVERVTHDSGALILLQGTVREDNISVGDAALFLRLRHAAAFVSVTMSLPTAQNSLLGDNLLVFQGSADVLGIHDLDAMGIEISRSYKDNYMRQDEIDDIFKVTVVRPAQSMPPSLVKVVSQGKVVLKEVADEPIRRVRVRR